MDLRSHPLGASASERGRARVRRLAERVVGDVGRRVSRGRARWLSRACSATPSSSPPARGTRVVDECRVVEHGHPLADRLGGSGEYSRAVEVSAESGDRTQTLDRISHTFVVVQPDRRAASRGTSRRRHPSARRTAACARCGASRSTRRSRRRRLSPRPAPGRTGSPPARAAPSPATRVRARRARGPRPSDGPPPGTPRRSWSAPRPRRARRRRVDRPATGPMPPPTSRLRGGPRTPRTDAGPLRSARPHRRPRCPTSRPTTMKNRATARAWTEASGARSRSSVIQTRSSAKYPRSHQYKYRGRREFGRVSASRTATRWRIAARRFARSRVRRRAASR